MADYIASLPTQLLTDRLDRLYGEIGTAICADDVAGAQKLADSIALIESVLAARS